MFNTRKIGLGLALAFGFLMTAPVLADDACNQTLADIDKATATLNSLQQLRDQINQRQADLNKGAAVTADAGEPMKCPACGMMMPTSPTATMTRAVKYGGKTYYCCKGCDMSATADK